MGLTGSSYFRVHACLASALYPQVRTAGGRWSTWGRVGHAFLCDAGTKGRAEALKAAPEEHRAALSLVELDRIPHGANWGHEVVFRYDVKADAAVEIARGDGSRPYANDENPWRVWGTADVVALTPDAFVCGDFKFGHGDLTPAKDNKQLRAYALMGCRAYGRDKAIGFLCRIRDDGAPWFDWAEYSFLDIDETAAEIYELCDRLEDARRQERAEWDGLAVMGPHCRHCRAMPHCPAQTKLAVALGTGQALPAVIDESNARAVYERLAAVRALVLMVDEALDEYARQHPIDLGGGWAYGEVERPRENLDPLMAEPVLKAAGLMGAVEVIPKLTKLALKDEVRKVVAAKYPTGPKPRGILGRTEEQVLNALRECGAATTARQRVVMRHKPKELPAGASLPNRDGDVPTTPQQDGPEAVRAASKGAGQAPPLEVIEGGAGK